VVYFLLTARNWRRVAGVAPWRASTSRPFGKAGEKSEGTLIPVKVPRGLCTIMVMSGLELAPMMVGAVLSSTISGHLVSRTGRYTPFPVIGAATTAGAPLLLSRLSAETSPRVASAYGWASACRCRSSFSLCRARRLARSRHGCLRRKPVQRQRPIAWRRLVRYDLQPSLRNRDRAPPASRVTNPVAGRNRGAAPSLQQPISRVSSPRSTKCSWPRPALPLSLSPSLGC
jgi:hypothetical protein